MDSPNRTRGASLSSHMRPDISRCTTEPTENPDKPALRIGWRHIRGLGEKSLEALKTARGWDRFASIDDVVQRAKLQRADALQLAHAGAFGCWEPDRRRAAWVAMRAVGDILPLAPARQASYDPRPLTRDELIFLDTSRSASVSAAIRWSICARSYAVPE